MGLLLLKLTLTPILIGGASLAARRWGPAVGGWLVALPLTSAPVALYLALEQNPSFAGSVAQGSLGGLLGDGLFALAYAWVARRHGWPPALLAGGAAFAVSAVAISPMLAAPTVILLLVVLAGMSAALWASPPVGTAAASAEPRRWDTVARMIVGTAVVLAITEVAEVLGPHLSGVVATFPVYVSVLASFAHHFEGVAQAAGILRGLQLGLLGTAVFLAVLAVGLPAFGIVVAFGAAIALSLAVHGSILVARRRMRRAAPEPEPGLM